MAARLKKNTVAEERALARVSKGETTAVATARLRERPAMTTIDAGIEPAIRISA
jgi:hypothetical protein